MINAGWPLRHRSKPPHLSSAIARLLGTLAIVGLLAVALTTLSVAQGRWSEPVSLSRNFPQSYLPDIAADQSGNLYVVWDALFEQREEGWADGIGFAMWDGTAWSEAVDISASMTHLPSIAVDSRGRLHLISEGMLYSRAWAQERPLNARAWTAPVDLSGGYYTYWNDIVVDSQDRVHAVFAGREVYDVQQCDEQPCVWIFYTRSVDGGDTWSDPVPISGRIGGGEVHLTTDRNDNLYVVWRNEHGGVQTGLHAGFVYSVDAGVTWGEPEVLAIAGADSHLYWLSVAVDSLQTIHVVGVTPVGRDIRHIYREGLDGLWVEVPISAPAGVGIGYGFRGIIVDNSDRLHFVLPTLGPRMFHASWTRENGWSDWDVIKVNSNSKGCGLGNLAMSGGNRLHLVWSEHLGESGGHLFWSPRGQIEIYYSSLQTDAPALPLATLPPMPTSTPAPTPTQQPVPSPTPSLVIPTWQLSVGEEQQAALTLPPLAVGIGLSMALIVLVIAGWSLRHRAL